MGIIVQHSKEGRRFAVNGTKFCYSVSLKKILQEDFKFSCERKNTVLGTSVKFFPVRRNTLKKENLSSSRSEELGTRGQLKVNSPNKKSQ